MINAKDKVKECERDLKEMKENQIIIFKRKYDYMRNDYKNKIIYDLKFTALFGNGIQVNSWNEKEKM